MLVVLTGFAVFDKAARVAHKNGYKKCHNSKGDHRRFRTTSRNLGSVY